MNSCFLFRLVTVRGTLTTAATVIFWLSAVVVCIQWCVDCKHYRWINNVEGHNSNRWIRQTSMFTWHEFGAWQQLKSIPQPSMDGYEAVRIRWGWQHACVMLRVERSIESIKLNIFVLHETWCRYWMFVHAENVNCIHLHYIFDTLQMLAIIHWMSVCVFCCVRFLRSIPWSRTAKAARISDRKHADCRLIRLGELRLTM